MGLVSPVGLVSLTEPDTFVSGQDSVPALPPLSGITVLPNQATGRYTLEFSQELEEPATVKVTNAKKKVVYANSLAPQAFASVKHLDVGKLSNGSYLVEVKTSNTTYWKKLDVSNQTVKSTKAGKTTKAGKSKKSGKNKKGGKSKRR
jgi:hypothetical protein